MYMILFEDIDTGTNVVSAIRRIKDADDARREWERVGDVYSAYTLSDVPKWDMRIITHKDK